MSDLALIREALRDPAIAAYPDFSKAVSDMCDQLERFRSERGYVVGCNDGFEVGVDQASQVAYRVCAETRHVTLGDKAAAAIRALSGKEARHQLCSDCADTSAISTGGTYPGGDHDA